MNEYEMIEISGGNGNGKKPVNKKILIAIIVPIVLLVFIFLSGAIYNHNRPTVTAALPLRGHINHREVTSGIVRYAESAEIYAELTGWVERVLVREGDSVSIGQPILEIDFRTSPTDAQEQIDIIQAQMETARAQHRERMNGYRIDRQTAQVELERIISDISNAERRLAELRDEEFRPTSISDFNIRQKEEEIARARQMLYQTTTLFHAGIATGQEVDAAELALATAIENHNQLLLSFEESLENEYTRQRDWERDQENRIRDAENQLEAHRRARRTRDLNTESIGQREETARRQHDESLASYQRRLENYQRRLAGYEYSTILSPAEGIITNLNVNQGQHINANQLLVEIGLTQYFVVEGDIPLSNNFVTVGNSAVLRNASGTVTGNVTQVVPQENAKRVTIALDTTTNTVTAGETFTITFEERSGEAVTLVPNSAVNRDGDGYFINQVRRRRGILGEEFYARRTSVVIGDSDDNNTAILQGISMFPEPVIVLSDRPFLEGQGLRLQNEVDFFGN